MQLNGFEFPDHLHYFLAHDMWCEVLGSGLVRVGISSFGVYLSGDFFMCQPKPVGTFIKQKQTLGVVELNKSVVTLKTPVSGRITKINLLLEATPEIIQRDPYGQGWLAELQATDWAADSEQLVHGPALANAMQSRLQLENLDYSQAASHDPGNRA